VIVREEKSMPDIKTDDGCTIHVEIEGPERAPVLMLSNSLGTDLHMWDEQVAPFTRHFRLVRYDRRGHGKSTAPKGPYSMERLGRDVLAVLDELAIQKIDWCGLSMGGMVGQWLGANAANRIDKLILSNTACYFPDKTIWDGRIKMVRDKGLAGIVDANMERWFTKEFRERSPQAIERMRKMFVATNVEGYVGCGEAIRDMDHRPLLAKITAPTLVIAGRQDPATPLEGNEFIRQHIPGAKIAVLEAAHIANMEQPQVYADTVLGFLVN
jgi:3-oxoadipate enol-lactonase